MRADIGSLQTYHDLLQAVQPRIVRTEEDAAALSDIVDLLTDRPRLSDDERDFIGLLIYDWESEYEPPVDVSPSEVVLSLLEENGLRQVDLVGPVFPSAPTVRDLVHERQLLSYERVLKPAMFFQVSPAVFNPAAAGSSDEGSRRRRRCPAIEV